MLKSNNLNTPIYNESVVQQVINKITDAIIVGELKPGDQLPPEMELINTFHVSRNSLRSAIQTLRAYGVLEVRRPEGTFVCNGVSPQMLNPMLYSILLQKESAANDFLDLRKIIDYGVSWLAIKRGITPDDVEHLEALYDELVEQLMAEEYSISAISEADKRLHQAVAELTQNSMVIMLNEFLLNVTSESRYRTIEKVFEEEDREYLMKTHRDYLDALQRKPGSDMEKALEFSYYYWKDSYNW